MDIYTYANCTSCRNAEALAAEKGVDATKRDIFKQRLSADELAALFARIGTTPTAMLSTRSRPYRDLGLGERTLDDDEIVSLMAEYPALIRRPIVVAGDQSQVGFNRAALERLIAATNSGAQEGHDDA